MLRIILTYLSIMFACATIAQESSLYKQVSQEYDTNRDIVEISGYLDNALPLQIAYVELEDMAKGLIQYGEDPETHLIEGNISDTVFSFFEFDDATVTAVITGRVGRHNTKWEWSTHDFSRTLPIVLHKEGQIQNGQVQIYTDKHTKDRSQVLLRPDRAQVSIELESAINMKWMDYACDGKNCYEGRDDIQLDNPIEFILDQDELKVLPSTNLQKLHELSYETTSKTGEDNFATYSYPVVGQKKFDKWITSTVEKFLNQNQSQVTSEDQDLTDRFARRSYGDFYITLLSKEILSGYLIFFNSNSNKIDTAPFNYNLNQKKFYSMRDFFKNDFDFPFFLKSYIDKKKRQLIYKEESIVKDLLQDEKFSHYVLSPGGILFFTNFNTIYGRRHILIPYQDIQSFVGDKNLNNYINKDRYR